MPSLSDFIPRLRNPSAPLMLMVLPLAPPTSSCAPTNAPQPPSIARAAFLEQFGATYRFRLGHPRGLRATSDGGEILFLRSGPRSFVHNLYTYSLKTQKERLLLTARKLLAGAAEKLSADEKARRERMRLAARGIVSFRLSKDGNRLLVPLGGRFYLFERHSGKVSPLRLPVTAKPPLDPRLSPDGRLVAYVREGDLYVYDIAQAKERRLTHRANERITNGLAEFVAQEEMGRRRGFWFAPDSGSIVFQETDVTGLEQMSLANPAKPSRPVRKWPYPRPGKRNAAVRLGRVSVQGGPVRWIDWDRKRYPYLVQVKWTPKAPLTLVVQDRRQREIAILAWNPSGILTPLWIERDEAWLNIDPKMPRWLPDGSGFLWATESGGATRLGLHRRDGRRVRFLHAAKLGYRRLVDVDPAADHVLITASAEPTESHVFALSLSGKTPPRQLSRGHGWHEAVAARRNKRLYVQIGKTLRGESYTEVRDRSGQKLGAIRSTAEVPPFIPRLELLTVGKRRYRVAVIRPRNFFHGVRYPVIVSVYGGPRHLEVTSTPYRYLLQQWVADHGFVVVSIDGRGTPFRGRAWERAMRGDMIRVPLGDQVEALKALGERLPELDLSRVGIFGWSYGGYVAALAVMMRPDVFKSGVAGAPVSEWLDYDTHYTERYLGLPGENKEGYRNSSVLTHAAKLRRPLLIIHGTVDDNVYFSHSIKLSDALFRAGIRHDFLPLSGFTHMVPQPLFIRRLYQRIMGHFQRTLLGPR